MDRRPELQPRTRSLWEQLSTPDPAIRDFLKPHDDEDGGSGADADRRPCTLIDAIGRERRGESGVGMITLMDAIGRESRGESGVGMITLMDAIGRESRGESDGGMITLMDAIGGEIHGESGGGSMINWKPRLRDRLQLRRDANALSATASNRPAEEYGREEEEEESKDEAPVAASMSLMALLEQTDNHWDDDGDEEEEDGAGGSALHVDEEDDEEEMTRACCVCMVRNKGAAFIPCGHTFCRPCSRELWLTRADCPLCNALIHDILHIF